MTISDWVTQTVWEGTSLKVMARVKDVDNELVLQSGLATVKYRVTASAVEVIALTSLTVSAVIFDTLQTSADDASWTLTGGFNFAYTFPPATFPTPVVHNLTIEFTDNSAPTAHKSVIGVEVTARETYLD